MRYAFFVGCTTLARLWGYEASTRRVAEKLGVELVDMPGSSCCGTTYLETLNHLTALTMAARNICIAEEMGLDIITICNGCTEVLTKANKVLKEDPGLRAEVNEVLAETGKRFKGTVKVKHFVRMLKEDIGLDELIDVTGADSVSYPNKLECCTGPIMGIREDVTWAVGLEKVEIVKKYANIMVTACPFCYLTYERCQLMAETSPDVPVVHYPQLLGLALGLEYEKLGLESNKIDASRILDFVEV